MLRNIHLTYVIGGLMWARFFIPVLALFYIASEVPLEQFAVIMGVFALAILLLEIPSGIIADLLGKKKTLIISRSLYVVEIILIAFCNGFWIFLIAKIISGVGVSMSSGTGESLIFDSLKKMKKEKDYKKVSGRLSTISNLVSAVIFITGGFLFAVSPKLPAIASIPLVAFGVFLTFFLTEPYKPSKKLKIKNSILHLKESFTYLKKSNYIKYLVIYSFPIAAIITITMSLSAAYFKAISFPIYLMGFLAFIGALLIALSAKNAHKIEEWLGERKTLRLIQLAMIIGIGVVSLMIPYWSVFGYFLIPLSAGFFGVVLSNYMNLHLKSSHRATLISIKNFFSNLAVFILFPIVGYISLKYSMQVSFIFLGGMFILTLIILYPLARRWKLNKIN